MRLERLRIFHQQLERELGPESISSTIFYFFESHWFELSTETHCNDLVSRDLERARTEPISYHTASSSKAWFYVSDLIAAVCLEFTQSPQLATRRRNRERILKIQESASNAYKVTHNPLTYLLARDAFREQLATSIAAVEKRDGTKLDAEESGAPRTLAVLALDIDHFKQVNDTWGHLYGDQVLRVFSRRLEQCAEEIRQKGIGSPAVFLGHPSGEEFLIIIEANVVKEQLVEWGNQVRRAICDEVMPTNTEWEWLSSSARISAVSPPPLHERAISASIGLATHNVSASFDISGDALSELLERADTALYRAKAAGRNQVISYDEILLNCGRVLEHDLKTKVLALDIGSNVGVVVGQEFKVFLPTFTGKTKFLLNDGRTKRTLGLYPRVDSARIVVFNSQPELSFAFIASTEPAPEIEVGSHLEAIPVGSIGHLLPSSSKYLELSRTQNDQLGISELQDFIKESKNRGPFAIVVRFAREAEYLRKYGSVSLNMALAQLYREAQLVFHTAKSVELLDRSSICIGGLKKSYNEKIASDFVEKIASELPELGVIAGIFCELDSSESEKDGYTKLDASNAIEFARFAAADAGRLPDKRVRHFNYTTASAVLQALRDSRSFETAYADFEHLRKLGLDSAPLLNLGGLIAGSLRLNQKAFEHYAAAIAKDPSFLIYKSNYGTAAYRLGEIDPALRVLNALPLTEIDSLATRHPYGYICYARLLAKARLSGSPMFDLSRFSQVASNAIAISESTNAPELTIVKEALKMI